MIAAVLALALAGPFQLQPQLFRFDPDPTPALTERTVILALVDAGWSRVLQISAVPYPIGGVELCWAGTNPITCVWEPDDSRLGAGARDYMARHQAPPME